MLQSVTNIPVTEPIMIKAGQTLRAGLDLGNGLPTIGRKVSEARGVEARVVDDM